MKHVRASLFAAIALLPSLVRAQSNLGRVAGQVIDAESKRPIADAGVQVVGTTLGTTTAIDGSFSIGNVAVGTVTIQVRRLGYLAQTLTGLMLDASGLLTVNVEMKAAAVQIASMSVRAAVNRGSIESALERQRNVAQVVSSITAEQIAKSPDANAAQALQRVSGITVQNNKYVFVRGLGERYTTASLNGARLPSPEPESKTVPLDLFPASLLRNVTTSKTYLPDAPADFSGASIDLETTDNATANAVTYGITAGGNSALVGRSVLRAPATGLEWLAMAGADRQLPAAVLSAGALRGLSQSENNALVRSLRNVWTPARDRGSLGGGTSVSAVGLAPILGRRFSYVASAAYGNSEEARLGETRARAVPSSATTQRAVNVMVGTSGRQSAQWGGLLNVSGLVGENTRLTLNNLYNRSADNEAHADSGYLDFGTEANTRRSTLSFVERAINSNQLKMEHALGNGSQLEWSLSVAGVRRHEPDRADLSYVQQPTTSSPTGPTVFALNGGTDDGAKRSFKDLHEHTWSAGANYTAYMGAVSSNRAIKLGGLFRQTKRSLLSRAYSIYANLSPLEAAMAPEDLFRIYSADTNSVLTVVNNSVAGSYSARDNVVAAYTMIDIPLGNRARLLGGARAEAWNLDLTTEKLFSTDQNVASPSAIDVLPALALRVSMGQSQELRLAAARTLARPEYREVSPLLSREVVGDVSTIGNPDLKRSLIDNLDVRWEAYPQAGEVVSVALFAKEFHQPIERVEVATSGATNYSFVNADGAMNFGVEFEVRRNLGMFTESLAPFSVFSNATLMQSRIRPGNENISALTNASRPMVGQAPYVINAGLTWDDPNSRQSATLLFNRVGRRITAAASKPLPDTYDLPRNILDVSAQTPLGRNALLRFNGKNLLDAPVQERQGSVRRLWYTTGRSFTVTVSLLR